MGALIILWLVLADEKRSTPLKNTTQMQLQSGIPQNVFEKSVSTLFLFGQLPVLAVTFVILVSLEGWSEANEAPEQFSLALLCALGSFVFSMLAMQYRASSNRATAFLLLSMVSTVIYLHFLVFLTDGHLSPFQHLYLYLPAVVLMVAQQKRWAEFLCSVLVFGSYTLNYGNHALWPAWSQFKKEGKWDKPVEIAFFLGLLVLLFCVNRRMEKLIRGESKGWRV